MNVKLEIYEKFGVSEYWIVDISQKQVKVFKENSNRKYKTSQIFEETDTVTWNGMSIKVAFIFEGLK